MIVKRLNMILNIKHVANKEMFINGVNNLNFLSCVSFLFPSLEAIAMENLVYDLATHMEVTNLGTSYLGVRRYTRILCLNFYRDKKITLIPFCV